MMKALSFKPPWSWALFHGKPIDNRKWRTTFTGRIYVHSSMTFDQEGYQWLKDNHLPEGVKLPAAGDFIKGAIIGEVTIVACVDYSTSRWYFGPHGLILSNAVEYPVIIPCKGSLGFFVPRLTPLQAKCLELVRKDQDAA